MAKYKTVAGPISLTIKQKESYADAVKQYAAIIDREAVGGWVLDSIQQIPVTKKADGCSALFGAKEETVFYNMLIFRNDML